MDGISRSDDHMRLETDAKYPLNVIKRTGYANTNAFLILAKFYAEDKIKRNRHIPCKD